MRSGGKRNPEVFDDGKGIVEVMQQRLPFLILR